MRTYSPHYLLVQGRAVAEAVSRRPPTAARNCAGVKFGGIYSRLSGTGASFLRVLQFPLPVIHSTNCSTIIAIIIIYHPGLAQ
jgi:hypothetical protein